MSKDYQKPQFSIIEYEASSSLCGSCLNGASGFVTEDLDLFSSIILGYDTFINNGNCGIDYLFSSSEACDYPKEFFADDFPGLEFVCKFASDSILLMS